MLHMDKTIISTETKNEGFNTFIELKSNKRIFFSASFGMGKTYFLNEFFRANSEKYNTFHLYPVKYQVHNDVDILEVIAADLFVQLAEQHEPIINKFLKDENGKIKLKNAKDLIIKCFGSLVGIKSQTIETIKKLLNGENSEVQSTVKKIHNSCLENFISEALKEVKDGREDKMDLAKENILILDDLDRLEPKHAFKILNAFSPLQDDEKNKFGFDRVIFVGDFNNLEKVYHHIYGNETDFNGYINKFFSKEPYQYNIEKEVLNKLQEIVLGHCNTEIMNQTPQPLNDEVQFIIALFVKSAIPMKVINLRNLFTLQKFPSFSLNVLQHNTQEATNKTNIDLMMEILLHIFNNDKEKFLAAIDSAEKYLIEKTVLCHKNFYAIHNLENIGAYMLHETFQLQKNQSNDSVLKKQEDVLSREYCESFPKEYEYENLYDKNYYEQMAKSFFKVFKEYVTQKEIYKTDLLTDDPHTSHTDTQQAQ